MSRRFPPIPDRGPLKTMFLLTSMPVGGAEKLLVSLLYGLDRTYFAPEVACLKELGELGQTVSAEITTTSQYLSHKYDLRVLLRLIRYLRKNQIDVLVTVGAGDKMFWGRIAARFAGTPVVVSALHSTGWPDAIGSLNRLLTPWTDAFVGVAAEHGRYLREQVGLPSQRVHVIPNGVDTRRFRSHELAGKSLRRQLGIPSTAPVCSVVAALRPEKNHELFLTAAARIRQQVPETRFLIVGDGPERKRLERMAGALRMQDAVHFLGTREDVPEILAATNCFLLTSQMEACPVSILEALATETPVVATNVGSVGAIVVDGVTGFVVEPGVADELVEKTTTVLGNPGLARQLGRAGRELVVSNHGVDRMVEGYQQLITQIYSVKAERRAAVQKTTTAATVTSSKGKAQESAGQESAEGGNRTHTPEGTRF